MTHDTRHRMKRVTLHDPKLIRSRNSKPETRNTKQIRNQNDRNSKQFNVLNIGISIFGFVSHLLSLKFLEEVSAVPTLPNKLLQVGTDFGFRISGLIKTNLRGLCGGNAHGDWAYVLARVHPTRHGQ